MFFSVSLLLYWAGLQKDADKDCLAGRATKLMHTAATIFSAPSAAADQCPVIWDCPMPDAWSNSVPVVTMLLLVPFVLCVSF
jgi:hypothetical protein